MELKNISPKVAVAPQISASGMAAIKAAGYDMNGIARRIANGGKTPTDTGDASFDVVIVGGGAGGISVGRADSTR